mgnify:CR=1 FL=1
MKFFYVFLHIFHIFLRILTYSSIFAQILSYFLFSIYPLRGKIMMEYEGIMKKCERVMKKYLYEGNMKEYPPLYVLLDLEKL